MKNFHMNQKDKNMENEYTNPSLNDMEKIVIANVTKELRKQLKGFIFVDYYCEPTIMSNIFKIKYINESYKFTFMFYDVEKWIADGTVTKNICTMFVTKLKENILQRYFW